MADLADLVAPFVVCPDCCCEIPVGRRPPKFCLECGMRLPTLPQHKQCKIPNIPDTEKQREPPGTNEREGEPPDATLEQGEPPGPKEKQGKLPVANDKQGEPPGFKDKQGEPPGPKDKQSEPPGPKDNQGEPPGSKDKQDEDKQGEPPSPKDKQGEPPPPSPKDKQGESPGSKDKQGEPPGPKDKQDEPPGSKDKQGEPPGSKDKQGEPPGPKDKQGEPPGSKDKQSEDKQGEPPGPKDKQGEPPGPKDKQGEPPGSKDKQGEPPGPIDKQGKPPGPKDKQGEPPGSKDKQGEPPGPKNKQGEPPGSKDKQGKPPGSKDKQGKPPGPKGKQGEPPGSKDKQSEDKQGEPPGPKDKQGEPPGSKDKQGAPPGPKDKQGKPPGPKDKQGEPPGSKDKQGEPPGPKNKQGEPPGSKDKQGKPPGSKDKQGEDKQGEPPGPRDKQGAPPGPGDKQGEPTGPIDKQGEPPGPKDKPPGPKDKQGEPPGSKDKQGEPPGPKDKQGEPPGPKDKQGEPPGPKDKQGEPPGSKDKQGEDKQGEPPGPKDKQGEPPGSKDKQGKPPGPKDKQSAPPGSKDKQGVDKQGEPPGPRDKQGEPSGPKDKQGEPPGPIDKQGEPSGTKDKQGELPGSKGKQGEDKQGAPPDSRDKQGEPPGPKDKQGAPPGSKDKQGEPPGPKDKQGAPPGSKDKQGEPPGPKDKQGAPPGSKDKQGEPPGSEEKHDKQNGAIDQFLGTGDKAVSSDNKKDQGQTSNSINQKPSLTDAKHDPLQENTEDTDKSGKNVNQYDGKKDNRKDGQPYKKSADDNATDDKNKNNTTPANSSTSPYHFNPPEIKVPSAHIEFHVLLSKQEWLWEDSAEVYIRFSDHQLGGFQCCHGPMKIVSDSPEIDVIELIYTVEVPKDILKSTLYSARYKYCVFSKANEFMKSPFEFISGSVVSSTQKGVIDRSLRRESLQTIQKEKYRKIDCPMHPEFYQEKLKELHLQKEESKPAWKKFISGIKSKFSEWKNYVFGEREAPIPSLHIYLADYYKLLTGTAHLDMDLQTVLNNIVVTYQSLYKYYFQIGNYPTVAHNKAINTEMTSWLLEIIEFYEKLQNRDATFNSLQWILVLLLIMQRLDLLKENVLEAKHYQILFTELCLLSHSEISNSNWLHFTAVEENMLRSENLRKMLVNVLTYMQTKAKQPMPEILFSFPILHFAQGLCVPFAEISVLPMDCTSAFFHFKSTTYKCFSELLDLIDTHPYLTTLDPLLLQFCAQAATVDQYERLANKVPLFLLITAFVEECPRYSERQDMRSSEQPADAITRKQPADALMNNKEKDVKALKLFIKIASDLKYSQETRLQIIKTTTSVIKLVKAAISRYTGHNLSDNMCSRVELVLIMLSKTSDFIDEGIISLMNKDWNLHTIVHDLIVKLTFAVKFGGYYGHRDDYRREIKIWSRLVEIDCPDNLEASWRKVLEDVIKSRLSQVKSSVIQVLQSIELDTAPEFFTEIILTDVLTNFDNIEHSSLESSGWLEHSSSYFQQSTPNHIRNILSKIMSKILNKKYPKVEDITQAELLDWVMWPSFLGMLVSKVEVQEDSHNMSIVAALSTLDNLCESIQKRFITLDSLDYVRQKRGQLRKLCDAVNSGKKNMCLPFSEVESHLNECCQLEAMFLNYRNKVSTLLEFCHKYYGLTGKLRGELNAHHQEFTVGSLFEPKSDKSAGLKCVCFSTDDVPEDLFKCLFIVGKKNHNDIFETCWRQKCNLYADLPSFTEVYQKVCAPVMDECKEILVTLEQRSMTLEDVEKHFSKFEENELHKNLLKLCSGIQECYPTDRSIPSDKNWIRLAVSDIQIYKKISGYMKTAQIVLELRNAMNWKGDFTAVDTLAQQMNKKLTLKVINQDLIEAGRELTELMAPGRCECLKELSKSADLVKWLKSETGSVGAVANFVEVATSTTGEGDFHLDKLSMLHTVATGYSSLIFDTKATTGFKELSRKCSYLWSALEVNRNLPQYLKQCKGDLDWYIEIKEIQGDVEVTSVNQVEDINNHGSYTISCKGKNIMQSIGDAITLKILRVKAAKKQYSFNDLRDLESKLVLIRGRNTKGGAEIDRFLNVFHLVCRIADTLHDLQNAGHTNYISWSLTFACSTVSEVGLADQATSMEKELSSLLDSVNQHRREFHALNYFTTQQLLQIRRELGNLKRLKPNTITVELYSLLMSFSLTISSDEVNNIVEEVIAIFSEQEALGNSNIEEQASIEASSSIPGTEDQLVETVEYSMAENELEDNVKLVKEELEELIQNLSEDEEALYEELRTDAKYSKIVCYKAVKHAFSLCADDDDKLVVAMDWCFDNANQYNDMDNDEANVGYDSVETINKNIVNVANNDDSEVLAQQMTKSEKPVQKENIDINHPVVQKLIVELGFSPNLAIKGTTLYNGDFDLASDWCLNAETEDDDGVQPLFGSGSHPIPLQDEETEVAVGDEWKEVKDEASATEYLGILETATVLEQIHDNFAGLEEARYFPDKILHSGEPNLIIVAPGDVLKAVLSLYMRDPKLPLPSSAEVCICTSTTTAEEVELLWHRAMKDPGFKNIYCLAHAERLSYQVCEAAFKEYDNLSQGNNGYRVAIVCSLEDEDRAHIVSKLHQYRREYPPLPTPSEISLYLKKHFINEDPKCAAKIDYELSSVRVVASDISGMGKSLYVKRLAQKLHTPQSHVIVPIHGPVVNADTVMTSLCKHVPDYSAPPAQIIHFDIASSVLSDVDTLLFSLLILKSLTNSKGQIWQCLPVQYYIVEVTYIDLKSRIKYQKSKGLLPSTMSLLELFPTVNCPSPLEVLNSTDTQSIGKSIVFMDDGIFRSARFQRVYQYLKRFSNYTNLAKFSYRFSSVEGNVPEALNLLLKHCGIRNPSWAELQNFVKFLNVQLSDCEGSIFCNEAVVGDILQGFKQFVVQFMIRMSRDFATPSLKAAVMYAENDDNIDDIQEDVTKKYEIVERRAWESSFHPYLFFNQDHVSVTFLGFKITADGNLVDPKTNEVIEGGLMTKQLRDGLTLQRVNFDENYNAWDKFTMIEKLCFVMGIQYMSDPDDSYVLTTDNMKKMMAIQMRFRCNIPVVIMGETGCGKTRLIRYMCDLQAFGSGHQNMLMMKVHGGITEQDIERRMNEVLELAKENKKASPPVDTVLFFDEANTTEAIGLIKEIMCDRRLNGKPIPEDIKFIAACNPYRKHSKEMIQRLENAGLGFYIKSTKTIHKLGSIPLRQLVYRVLALPPSMQPLVYDFGQLTDNTEEAYTTQIVTDRIQKKETFTMHPNIQQIKATVSHVLAASQMYMRNREDECSFVSLRDVERAMIVFEWFFDKHKIIEEQLNDLKDYKPLDPVIRSLIMAVAVCYHARLQKRTGFEEYIVQHFLPPFAIPGGQDRFSHEIVQCQTMFLRQMKLGPNIASNAALRENVFMMVVCIELRIPLFLVGKPGSSKSLAKSIIADSMQGHTSHKKFLKELKQVKMFSYQCSQLSTPESVLEVFGTATKFQKNKDTTRFVSVVVLDEVGLAEDSPSLPLKALHPLLEDGTSGADKTAQSVAREKRVAFVGISNWALDPAKMNRGVMVTRGKPDEEELVLSAGGICSVESDKYRDRLEKYFRSLAKAYLEICDKQHPKEFFGLRDFYSLIKMLYWMVKNTNQPLTMKQLEHAVKRNFGGLKDEEVDAVAIFKEHIIIAEVEDDIDDPVLKAVMYPDCSAMGLINTSLATKETSWHGESRYLLFLTENYAALRILQQDLLFDAKDPPFVLFGSSFPKDREYTQVCRNINQIKICMETGRSVILLNLENLYESLYDVLNQYYTLLPGKRYVDLGLQTHRIKCRVHDDFKLILIAEKDKVYEEFPTPLINRLEKHFVVTSTVLTEHQKQLLVEVEAWANNYACIRHFKVGDAFVGYQNDTPAAVVFQVTHLLKDTDGDRDMTDEETCLLWRRKALAMSKRLLMETASPDSVVRLKAKNTEEMDECVKIYFNEQCHSSLCDLLKAKLLDPQSSAEGLLLHVTTHSHLMSRVDANLLHHSLGLRSNQLYRYLLQEFDTEMDFSYKIRPIFRRRTGEDCLLIIECDAGHLNIDLIACARHRIIDERVTAMQMTSDTNHGLPQQATHVVFIVQLPKQVGGTKFVGFQGAQWYSVHIDDLSPPKDFSFTLPNAFYHSMSEIFGVNVATNAIARSNPETLPLFDAAKRLHGLIQKATSRLQDNEKNKHRTTQRIEILLDLIPEQDSDCSGGQRKFHHILTEHIGSVLCEKDSGMTNPTDWAFDESMESKKLRQGGTFRNCLSRKFDEVIVPIFAEILGAIDKNYNLNLIHHDDSQSSPIAQLWLGIFANKQVCKFSYDDFVTKNQQQKQKIRGRVPGIGTLLASPDYTCQFPFSWLVRDAVDSQWNNATASATQSEISMYTQLYDLVATTALGRLISDENFRAYPEECVKLYGYYLSDFVEGVYRTNRNTEVKLIYQGIDSVVQSYYPESANNNLLKAIVAVHVAYDAIKGQIQQFQNLASLEPGIVDVLINTIPYPAAEVNLAYFAVQEVLEILTPNFDHWDQYTIKNWIRKLHRLSIVIEAVLSFKTIPGSQAEELKITNRYKWQRMCVIKMFAEHISLNFTENEINLSARRLWMFLAKPNFQSETTISRVKKVMDSLDQSVRKTWNIQNVTEFQEGSDKSQVTAHRKFRQLCRSFFMEVISTLCFERTMPNPPETKLVEMLMDIVFSEGKSTKILSPFKNEQADPSPVIRSYLLQLLLEFSSAGVRTLLKLYFKKSRDLVEQDQELYILCVQCFEDAIYKQSSELTCLQDKINFVAEKLTDGHEIYEKFDDTITLEYLEAIASLRYVLSVTSAFISKCYQSEDYFKELQPVERHALDCLFEEVQRVCLLGDHTQLHVFLMKFIVRRFGMQFLKQLVDKPNFDWLIPPQLQPEKKENNTTIDPYILYGKNYKSVREAIALSICGSNFTELDTEIKQFAQADSIVISLALYQQITFQGKNVPAEGMEHLTMLVQNCTLFTNEMRYITDLLIHNKQGIRLTELQTHHGKSPHHGLLSVVVHCAVVFTHTQQIPFLKPFFNLMYDPASMKRAYLPTMPDDSLFRAMNVLAGKYYVCPKGHPYHISECGGAVARGTCPECGAAIGGLNYKLETGNIEVQRGDKTQTGHVLGSPEKRSVLPEPERSLPPSGCALLRLLLHAVLVWSSSDADDNHSAELADMVHPDVPGDYLPQFYWEHLQRDLDILSKSLNLNKDETALVVHNVLRSFTQLQQYPACDASLGNKQSREQWEQSFYQTCAFPVLKSVQDDLKNTLDLIANDDSQGHDDLFFTIYEKIPVQSGDLQPAMWRYRARITLEHLTHALQQRTIGKGYVILKEFLRLEPVLRVTQYLPDILYLQKLLFDHFHQRIDQVDALEMSIEEYLMTLHSDNLKRIISKLIQSFNKAWVVAKQHLVNYGKEILLLTELRYLLQKIQFSVPEDYVTAMPTINDSSKLAYLIPTTTKEGICSTVLLDYLVATHNKFVKFYHDHYPLAEKYSENELIKNSIPLSQLQDCHLLNYESHIIPVVLNHCHHSLKVGKGTDIQYDLPALEKKIVDRFIHGKPLIQFENAPRVVYRKDTHDAAKFNDVRTNVQQDKVTSERQKMILAELRSPQKLSEVLDVIDVVLGFLASAGGDSKMILGDYVKKILKMTRRILPKVIQECTLANMLSLWEVLSVEQARQLTLIDQEPFDKVDEAFKKQLNDDLLKRLHLALRRFPLDYLLSVLHEFIITHVSHVEQGQNQWPLKDTLYEFLDRQNLPEFKELQHFPHDLLMCHVTSTWKEIVLHQNEVEK